MAGFEDTTLVLQEVAQVFSRDDDVRLVKDLRTVLKGMGSVCHAQLRQLTAVLTEWNDQVRSAEEQFVHIAPPSEFQHKVETLDHEKFNVAKHINNMESTCQALERTYASVMAQRAALEQIESMYRKLDEVECAIAKQLKRDSPAFKDASLQHFPVLQDKVKELDVLIRDVETQRDLAEEAARLKHIRARLSVPDALRVELDALKKAMELGSFMHFYQWISPVQWSDDAQLCKGVLRAPPGAHSNKKYNFEVDATNYSPVFIANHLWDMIDAYDS